MIESIVLALLHFVESLGYFGIFVMAMIESTFIPVASEITMVPAGYLVHQGKLEAAPVFIASLCGSISGSCVNYWIAWRYGRNLLIRHHKLFIMSEETLRKVENFFARHGAFSVFIGRMTYGVRHYISFPAGLAKMDLKKFLRYTAMGDALWVTLLLSIGYAIGGNEAALKSWLPLIKLVVLCALTGAAGLYIWRHRKNKPGPGSL